MASGLRLYATVAVLGFLGRSGALTLPAGLHVLANQWVILVAAALYLVEFLADKIPIVDSVWDLVHTFIRVPAAALLAWAATAGVGEEGRVIAALLCGGVALSAHGLKSGARVALNASPEPVTNWMASFAEDGLTAVLLLLAVKFPLVGARRGRRRGARARPGRMDPANPAPVPVRRPLGDGLILVGFLV